MIDGVNMLPAILKVEDHFKKLNVNLFLFVTMDKKNVYHVYIHNIEMGYSHLLCKYKDWDTTKEQTRFYSEFLSVPYQYALD